MAGATPSLKAFSKRSRFHTIRPARHPARILTFSSRKPRFPARNIHISAESCDPLQNPCESSQNPCGILVGSLRLESPRIPLNFRVQQNKKKHQKSSVVYAFFVFGHHQNPLESPRIIFAKIPQGSRQDPARILKDSASIPQVVTRALQGLVGILQGLRGFLAGFVGFLAGFVDFLVGECVQFVWFWVRLENSGMPRPMPNLMHLCLPGSSSFIPSYSP